MSYFIVKHWFEGLTPEQRGLLLLVLLRLARRVPMLNRALRILGPVWAALEEIRRLDAIVPDI